MENLLLGIDVGTTSVKAGIFSIDGELISFMRSDYKTYCDIPGYAEQDADDWWRHTVLCIKAAMSQGNVKPEQISAVGVDSMTPVLLCLDDKGNPLARAQIWADSRNLTIFEELESLAGKQMLETSGNRILENLLAPKIFWLMKNNPALYKKTKTFILPNGYINLKLTGALTFDRSNVELSMLGDKITGEWDATICSKIGLDSRKLPDVFPCDKVIGTLSVSAAAETGLKVGTPVISGANDSAISAYAMKVTQKGEACFDLGNAGNLGLCLDKPVSDRCGMIYKMPLPERWIRQDYVPTAGAAFRWFKELLSDPMLSSMGGKEKPYDYLCTLATAANPGSGGVLFIPHLAGFRDHLNARACFIGMSLATGRAEMVRATLEGCALATKKIQLMLEAASGIHMKEVFMGGGGASSQLWAQIYADVLSVPIKIPRISEAAIFGIAMLAGIGAGILPKTVKVSDYAQIAREYWPIKQNVELYASLYKKYCDAELFGVI